MEDSRERARYCRNKLVGGADLVGMEKKIEELKDKHRRIGKDTRERD